MTRLRLGLRLAARDLRRRATEAVLLFVALVVAATTMTIGLVLHGQTAAPYAETRQRTAGPDVVALVFPGPGQPVTAPQRSRLQTLATSPGVVAHSRAFPMEWTSIAAHGLTGVAEVAGRGARPSAVDRPMVVSGRWVGRGGVVVERAFAVAMGIHAGDRVDLGGHLVRVRGIAVSAALPPYPQLCTIGCILDRASWFSAEPGLVWTTRQQALALADSREPVVWSEYLRLRDPEAAPAFVARHGSRGDPAGRPELTAWQDVEARQAEQLANERAAVVFGSTLLVILALATLVVLVGGRMADEVRRVGLLKAAGATPGYVARLLLVSYLAVGLVAGCVGLVAGRLLAPRLVGLSAGLLGRAGGTTVTPTDAAVVVGSVVTVVAAAAVVPAWRAARTSTVRALSDGVRAPRRLGPLVTLSSRLPAPALLGVRLAARRPRRASLTTISIAVAVCGALVVLYAQSSLHAERGNAGGPADPQVAQLHTVTAALTLLLALMAAVNLVFVTRASAADARRTLAVARALGASPGQTAAGLGIAQVLPAFFGLALGGLAGTLLFHALSTHPVAPPAAQLVAVGVLTLGVTAGLTAVPARFEARRPVGETLREG